MAVTPASFRTHHETWWATVPDAILQAAIDRATRRYDATEIDDPDDYDDLVEWAVAYAVGSGPSCRDKRTLPTADAGSILDTYLKERDRIAHAYGRSGRVAP